MAVYMIRDKQFDVRSETVTIRNRKMSMELEFEMSEGRFNGVAGTLEDKDVSDKMIRLVGLNHVMNQSTVMSVRLIITSDEDSPFPKLELMVTGPFIERLLREFIHDSWKLRVDLQLTSDRGRHFDRFIQDLRPVFCDDDSVFRKQWTGQQLHFNYQNERSSYSGFMTIKVEMLDMDVFAQTTLLDCQETNKRILEERDSSDWKLFSKNNVEFPCHSVFLKEIPTLRPSLEKALEEAQKEMECEEEGTTVEAEEKSSKLDLSEEGVGALLKYVYYNDLTDLVSSSKLAVELLQFAHSSLYEQLENAVKEVILSSYPHWMIADVALVLHNHCLKVGEEPELKWKAAQAIKEGTAWSQLGLLRRK